MAAPLLGFRCLHRASIQIPSPPTDAEICAFHVAITGGEVTGAAGGLAHAHRIWAGPGDSAGRVVSGVRLPSARRLACARSSASTPLTIAQLKLDPKRANKPVCANATLYGPRDTVTASYSLCAPLQRRCPLANVTHSVVFLKTYKTGGSTFANVLQRYARNRGLPMVETGGHAKCATGQAVFRCDGPADKYYGLAVHTVSHLRLGGRNASAARVAQRCAPDIPLDTAAGWRACAARLALDIAEEESGAPSRHSHRRFFRNATLVTLLRDPAEQAASALEQFNAPTMAGCRRIPPARNETARAMRREPRLKIKYNYAWKCPDVDRPLDRDGAVRFALNSTRAQRKALHQPQIFQSASWVLGFPHIDQLRSAPPLDESVRPAAIEFLARLQNEVDAFLTSESFNAGLYAFAQREGWGFVDLYFLKHKERGGGSVALQPSTRAALEQRSWFDSILYKALSECCSPRHEGGEVAEVCGVAPIHSPSHLTQHPT